MNRVSGIIILALCVVVRISGQTLPVYPGDITNNGVVNNLDFLQMGLAYNYVGPARDSVTGNGLAFAPQAAHPWAFNLPGGLNMAYADCNGDGLVNYYYDAFPLYANYGLQRPTGVVPDVFISGLPGIDPALKLDPAAVPAVVQGGQFLSIPIILGTPDIPAEDLYGIAFSVFVDPLVIDANQVGFNFSEYSWANPDNDRIFIYKKVSDKRIDVSWVRTDRNQKTGAGKIGYLDIIIIVDVVGLQGQYPVRLDSIKMMDKFGNFAAVAGDTILLTMGPDENTATIDRIADAAAITLWPNPVSEHLFIRSSLAMQRITLFNALGEMVLQTAVNKPIYWDTPLPNLPEGIYLARIETTRGTLTKPLHIQH